MFIISKNFSNNEEPHKIVRIIETLILHLPMIVLLLKLALTVLLSVERSEYVLDVLSLQVLEQVLELMQLWEDVILEDL